MNTLNDAYLLGLLALKAVAAVAAIKCCLISRRNCQELLNRFSFSQCPIPLHDRFTIRQTIQFAQVHDSFNFSFTP